MKKFLLTICLTLAAVMGSFAQSKGDAAIGASLLYGTDIDRAGLGVKMQYNISDPVRLEADWDCFFKQNHFTFWTINVNAQYLISLADKVKFYPLAGLGVCYAGWSGGGYDDSESKLGFNLGMGLQYDFATNFFGAIEAKYAYFKHYDQCVLGIGFGYRF
ncbi:MAG: porin family protein [Bacteroidales bacterium]|nr:porin family protein [Bacteroidales bacterium]